MALQSRWSVIGGGLFHRFDYFFYVIADLANRTRSGLFCFDLVCMRGVSVVSSKQVDGRLWMLALHLLVWILTVHHIVFNYAFGIPYMCQV